MATRSAPPPGRPVSPAGAPAPPARGGRRAGGGAGPAGGGAPRGRRRCGRASRSGPRAARSRSVLQPLRRSSRILARVPRNDPTDTGGLFIGRRPGTGPLHYRAMPERGRERRRRVDGLLAAAVLAAETLLCLSVWGPQPLGWLWVGSQVDYRSDSHILGVAVAFAGIVATLFLT